LPPYGAKDFAASTELDGGDLVMQFGGRADGHFRRVVLFHFGTPSLIEVNFVAIIKGAKVQVCDRRTV
jgi:hypothetical protein